MRTNTSLSAEGIVRGNMRRGIFDFRVDIRYGAALAQANSPQAGPKMDRALLYVYIYFIHIKIADFDCNNFCNIKYPLA